MGWLRRRKASVKRAQLALGVLVVLVRRSARKPTARTNVRSAARPGIFSSTTQGGVAVGASVMQRLCREASGTALSTTPTPDARARGTEPPPDGSCKDPDGCWGCTTAYCPLTERDRLDF